MPLIHEALLGAQQAAAQPKNASPAAESALEDTPPPAQPACWFSIRSLCAWLGCITGCTPGPEMVRRLTKALGYTWKKAKKLLGKACPLRRAEFVQQLGERLQKGQ